MLLVIDHVILVDLELYYIILIRVSNFLLESYVDLRVFRILRAKLRIDLLIICFCIILVFIQPGCVIRWECRLDLISFWFFILRIRFILVRWRFYLSLLWRLFGFRVFVLGRRSIFIFVLSLRVSFCWFISIYVDLWLNFPNSSIFSPVLKAAYSYPGADFLEY